MQPNNALLKNTLQSVSAQTGITSPANPFIQPIRNSSQSRQHQQEIRCPAPPLKCKKTPYRTFDGSCNNLQNPSLGVAISPYGRLLTPNYSDGIHAPPVSVTGEDLPLARLVSLVAFGEADIPDPQFTLGNMQWGQVVTHDMSMQAGGTQSKKHKTRCCTDGGKIIEKNIAHPTCFPILVPPNDPAHSQTGRECMNFVRTLTDRSQKCPGNEQKLAEEQLTVVTHFMDMSLVYGNSRQQNSPLRSFRGGRMITEERNGAEWLPRSNNATSDCDVQSTTEVCYRAGDVRVNQNPGLTIFQTILLREHNRLADALAALNPHYDDELLFQEARKINIAQYQHITYYEWLPLMLGAENMLKNRLIYPVQGGRYVNDYDPTVDPRVLNSHATAAFRFFHSQIEGRLDLISEVRGMSGALRLSDWLNRPGILEVADNFDSLTRGMATQPEELTDSNFDTEIKHFLFRRSMAFGTDLRALDIQRNRDHALATYNDFREFCGIRRASTWEDFLDLIPSKKVEALRSLYRSPEDVDLTVGGALEVLVEGALAGPTFLCILTEQFYRTRAGDRFFFEREDPLVGFTSAQLNEIRKASVARLMCDNGNNITSVQTQAFRTVSANNPVLPCTQIPQLDIRQWQDLSYGREFTVTAQSFLENVYKKK
ncbi:unnamed protein product [Hermetia illucens]|uniref:Peroxidase n=1 Tax=Hermetia illucens TaxID=343691 RepID=A0A7R8V2Y8_HERIL|nr:unnamed protein product [Hermetia illucens]